MCPESVYHCLWKKKSLKPSKSENQISRHQKTMLRYRTSWRNWKENGGVDWWSHLEAEDISYVASAIEGFSNPTDRGELPSLCGDITSRKLRGRINPKTYGRLVPLSLLACRPATHLGLRQAIPSGARAAALQKGTIGIDGWLFNYGHVYNGTTGIYTHPAVWKFDESKKTTRFSIKL